MSGETRHDDNRLPHRRGARGTHRRCGELPIPPYRGDTLPSIDYDAHPAYGGMFARPTLRERLSALNVFLRTFAFVTIRRIVDYDNMPLSDQGSRL